MTTPGNEIVLAEIKAQLGALKPSLDGLLTELSRQQRQAFDNSDFVLAEFRSLTRAIDGLSAQIARIPQ